MSAIRTALTGLVTRIESITPDTSYDRIGAFTYDSRAFDVEDLQHTRQFVVLDLGGREQVGAQGATNSPSEYIASCEIGIVYDAGSDADEIRKVLAEDIDRIRYTLQDPTYAATDGAIHRTVGEALIELPDGEDSQVILTVPVAVRYRPSF